MNFYKVQGQITAFTSGFLSNLGFKNIKGVTKSSDSINLLMKDGNTAGIRYLQPGVRGVYWSVADFKHRADELSIGNKSSLYDESKFEEAMDAMINKHDASIGINWDVIDFWLDELCLKKK